MCELDRRREKNIRSRDNELVKLGFVSIILIMINNNFILRPCART